MPEIKWFGRKQPLAVLPDGKVITYRGGRFYLMAKDGTESRIGNRFLDYRKILTERIALTRRLFRREIRCCCFVSDSELIFFKNHNLYYLDINGNSTLKIWELPNDESMPLNIVETNNRPYIAYWGEYSQNLEKGSVHIYGLTNNFKVEIVYSFPPNTIRHIHNIISDEDYGYYIFTGDTEPLSGIYHTDRNFNVVEPVYIGKQQARAVVGFVADSGLLYATDSVEEVNHIYYLRKVDPLTWDNQQVCRINGSCIYGAKYSKGFIFSTTVESSESKKKTFFSLLSRRLGAGILSDQVELIHMDFTLNYETLTKFKKDRLPYKLFQYGTVRFANNRQKRDTIYLYPIAVKKYDGLMGLWITRQNEHTNADK